MFSKISIKKPVTTVMLILIIVLVGIVGYMGLSLQMMPSVDMPMAVVSTTYIGAAPEEIEELVTKPIEEAMASVSNVDTITSTSASNSSMVMIQFVDGTDVDLAAIDMREKLDKMKASLPADADEPMVIKYDMNAASIDVGVSSDRLELSELNTLLEDTIVKSFEKISGVASVDMSGGIKKEIQIVVSPEKMQGYGLSTSQIAQVLKAENSNYPSGKIYQSDKKLQIRTTGEFKSIDEIKQLELTTPKGALIHISDIANVQEVQKDIDSYSIINGKRGIVLSINKQSKANVVDVTEKINKTIANVVKQYPDLKMTAITDDAGYIKNSVNNVTKTAMDAAVLSMLIIFLFLRDTKSSLIIGVSIPTSILATFALMSLAGMTLNIVSMSGIAMAIGLVVDDSVVVLENIHKKLNKGMNAKQAAEEGASEVGMAVMASTLTTLAVFIPLLFVKGTMGQMLRDLSLTMCFALSASLIVALTFVPMACAKLLKPENEAIKTRKNIFTIILDAVGKALDIIEAFYKKILEWALENKKKTIAIVFAIFVGTLSLIPLVGMELVPSMDQGVIGITIELPKGSVLEQTGKIVDQVIEKTANIEEVELVYTKVGGSSTDTANVTLNLVNKEDRKRSSEQISDQIKQQVKSIAGAKITVSASANAMGSLNGADISFTIQGDDIATLRSVSNDIVKLAKETSGLKDVKSSVGEGVEEANVKINRSKAAQYGINTATIANAINTAVTGSVATTYRLNGTEIDVRVKYDKERTSTINDLRNITVSSATGVAIPITEVADINIEESSVAIQRKNQQKIVTIEANADGVDANTAKVAIEKQLSNYKFPDGYSYSFTGTMDMMTDSLSSFGAAFLIAILLVYMIMASQFESLAHPFVVMFSMPLAFTGGILGLFLTGNPLSIIAIMGFIMLAGTVVKNGIVLVDYTNQLIEKNPDWSTEQALIVAGPYRLRPILMTTLATVLGFLAMVLATAEGSEMMKPLAIVDMFGLSISTLVTLVVIPIVYCYMNRFKKKKKKIEKNIKKEEKVETLV
jgi:HAE1 family hydrophobic/amphiphilic exporter-1